MDNTEYLAFVKKALKNADYREEQGRNVRPCPLCGSDQIQLCLDYNNHIKDLAKCRECKCQAPLQAWNNRLTA